MAIKREKRQAWQGLALCILPIASKAQPSTLQTEVIYPKGLYLYITP